MRFLDAGLLAQELLAPEQGGERQAAFRVQVTLPFVGAPNLFVGSSARDTQSFVERRRAAARRARRFGGVAVADRGHRENAPRDTLQIAGGLRRGAVDEERPAPPHGEPGSVVVLDVAEVIEVD